MWGGRVPGQDREAWFALQQQIVTHKSLPSLLLLKTLPTKVNSRSPMQSVNFT